ncbi:MAG: hypothetical protein D6696_01310 [Acidobacteria bacterium]|nr:MAG: hypothetical protein D6696_01310 [Acidobacteriota bacterium]
MVLALPFLVLVPAEAASLPELRFEAPPRMAPLVERLQRVDRTRLLRVAELTGLSEPGPPIRVVLAPEGSAAARRAPSWGVGYAFGAAGLVVLMPSRVPGYPDQDLESVLLHEVAHVLIARAARRRPIPRWFDEGVAMAVSRHGLADRTHLIFATIGRGSLHLADLDAVFPRGSRAAARAYALSGAVVRWLIEEHGEDVVARILAGAGAGLPFDVAFERATGRSLAAAEAAFWRRMDFWNKWVPFLTSSIFLWLLVTALAIVSFVRRRQRDEEIRRRWDAEDAWSGDEDGWVN